MEGLYSVPRLAQAVHPPCVSYEPNRDIIAASFCDEHARGSVYIFGYTSGDILHIINNEIATSIAFSMDGAHLFTCLGGSTKKFGCTDTTLGVFAAATERSSVIPITHSCMLCCEAGGVVLACVQFGGDTIITFLDVGGIPWRTVVIPGFVSVMAWLGADVCCKTFGGKMHIIKDEWVETLRGTWVAACVSVPLPLPLA
jgi:hypothetical protein